MSRAKRPSFRPHLYASHAVGTGSIASDRALLFGWTGTHWSPQDEKEAERAAYLWLVAQNADWASADNARKAFRAACLFAPALPALTSRVVIPARNGYVHLERRGCFDPALPAAMAATLHEVKAETNSILAWMEDCEVRTLTACATPKERVFEHYRAWCSASAMHEVSVVQFWKRMKSHLNDLAETRTRVDGQQRRMCNICLPGTGPV